MKPTSAQLRKLRDAAEVYRRVYWEASVALAAKMIARDALVEEMNNCDMVHFYHKDLCIKGLRERCDEPDTTTNVHVTEALRLGAMIVDAQIEETD